MVRVFIICFIILILSAARALAFDWPTKGIITSKFGKRMHPITKKWSFHEGIDIANTCGTPVYASRTGVVVLRSFTSSFYGNLIKIRHRGSFVTVYAHLLKILVSSGDKVKRGQVIGRVGDTGRVTGCHLHFEIRRDNWFINPLDLLED